MPAARSRLSVIFFTILVDLIGFGIIIPILPYYAQRLGAHLRPRRPPAHPARDDAL